MSKKLERIIILFAALATITTSYYFLKDRGGVSMTEPRIKTQEMEEVEDSSIQIYGDSVNESGEYNGNIFDLAFRAHVQDNGLFRETVFLPHVQKIIKPTIGYIADHDARIPGDSLLISDIQHEEGILYEKNVLCLGDTESFKEKLDPQQQIVFTGVIDSVFAKLISLTDCTIY